ncbi:MULTISPECIES: hypothetical protein [unclassified Sedimentibacter]|uniref:hypothetical protein n=1 Tax=unclassified Sedimentibacter TaxID=2649220 RepID=UPI0027E0A7B1|nr:hypothetical protein [Sedimentibacter sp. MB35-C1]WMJ78857.1 hypothetical protein RBQ61_07985 [Sedimentibacter sp. MB35-C1]
MIDIKYDSEIIKNKRETIKKQLFERSINIKTDNFSKIEDNDLYILFELYDEIFLCSWFKDNFKGKIILKLSKQLSRAAGNTKTSKCIAEMKPEDIKFEIKISLNHLANFNKVDRIKYVGGIEAASVLDGLMLVFEHEICHVIEFLIYHKSSCSKKTFKNLIFNIFGHVESTHKLIGVKEANMSIFGMRPGDNVKFMAEGRTYNGFIQKINTRATVMCFDERGRYIDEFGRRLTKFYVPLESLMKDD